MELKTLTNMDIKTMTDTEYILCRSKVSKVQKNLYNEIRGRGYGDIEAFELMHIVAQEIKIIKKKRLTGMSIIQAVLAVSQEPEKVKNTIEYFNC